MKALKIIGVIVLVLLVLLIILGLVAPKKYLVERSVMVNAPPALVFKQVQYWKNWQAWSPWAAMDTAMQVTYTGTDGEVGSAYQWIGDPDKTGKGEISNTGLKPGEQIDYHLNFMEPWESESDGYLKVAAVGESTQVTWGMFGKTPFPWNIMNLFMSMDKMLGKDFEHGLQLLKAIGEKETALIQSYQVQTTVFPARTYAAIRQSVKMADMQKFYGDAYAKIMAEMQKAKVKMVGAPVGLYYSWDEKTQTSDMAAAIPIAAGKSLGSLELIQLPAGNAYVIDYYGAYDKLEYAHYAFDSYFKQNKLTQKSPVIEEYITDPAQEPDHSKWVTKIYYFAE